MKDVAHIAVFDIGGTWFRSAVMTRAGKLSQLAKVPAHNYINTPHENPAELQDMLVAYLASRVKHLQALGYKIEKASVSMGAALDARTGRILNSGPLWGPNSKPFDLPSALTQAAPRVKWLVINDVSAALLRYVDLPEYAHLKRINLITVSSGIACRTYAREGDYIPVNQYGVQGEIGHIPIDFTIFSQILTMTCDCGGKNHLNAFSSGRGIENVLKAVHNYGVAKQESFYEAVASDEANALKVLDAVTLPLAKMIIHMLTIDAEVEKILVTGGVVHSISRQYIESLIRNLENVGMYQIHDQPSFFREIVSLGIDDDNSGLLGAAKAYDHSYTY